MACSYSQQGLCLQDVGARQSKRRQVWNIRANEGHAYGYTRGIGRRSILLDSWQLVRYTALQLNQYG